MPTSKIQGVQHDVDIISMTMLADGGNKVDLLLLYDKLTIFEDIFQNSMSGYISMVDSYNLPETFPIVGEETISFEFTSYVNPTADNTMKKSFRVTGVEKFESDPNSQYSTYFIHFVSREFTDNQRKRLNCSFGTEIKPVSSVSIFSTMCDKMLGISPTKLKTEPTRFDRNIVCGNWTPFQTINFLCESDILHVSASPVDKESTFLFFEDRFRYNYVSWSMLLEDLFVSKKWVKNYYFGSVHNIDQKAGKKIITNQVIDYRIEDLTNGLENTSAGMFSNRFVYHDIINKTVTETKYNYKTEFPKMAQVDKKLAYPLMTHRSIEPKESTSFLPKEYHYQNDSNSSVAWRQKAKSRHQMFENYKIVATVTGNSGLKLGSLVMCDVPSTRKKGTGERESYGQLAGNYLVTRVRHEISKKKYLQVVELRKGAQHKVAQ